MTKSEKPQWKTDRFSGQDIYPGMYIKDIISILQEAAQAQDSGKWKNLTIEIEEEYGSHNIVIIGSRLETQAECIEREKHIQTQEQHQRKLYEQLKKKFEG